jgi:hypothetical protein
VVFQSTDPNGLQPAQDSFGHLLGQPGRAATRSPLACYPGQYWQYDVGQQGLNVSPTQMLIVDM